MIIEKLEQRKNFDLIISQELGYIDLLGRNDKVGASSSFLSFPYFVIPSIFQNVKASVGSSSA